MTRPQERTDPAWVPERLMELGLAFTSSRVLAAGVQLGVFAHVAAGRRTAVEVARAAGASERGMAMLLDGLVALGLLDKAGGAYRLPLGSERYLLPEGPEYACARLEDDSLWDAWGGLVEAVRAGLPACRVGRRDEAERFFPRLVGRLHAVNRAPAARAARALGAGEGRGLRVVDVACGSGVWGIAVAEADPRARLTLQDFPGVLEHTRGYLGRHGVLDRCDFLPGDLKEVDFGEGRYDLALLGHIVHWEGERSSRALFGRLHRALRPGGKLAVVDMVPDEGRTGPPYPLLFALNMLVHTPEGGTYTLGEYRSWLTEAGFARVETADIGWHSPLVVGAKG